MGTKGNLLLAALFLMFAICILPAAVFAHAGLSQSFPAREAQLAEAPHEIRVKFTEPIDTKLSQLILKDDSGSIIECKQRSEGELSLILEIPELPDGVYHVSWQVLSRDTHITDGSYRFSVGVPLPKQIPQETISLDQTPSFSAGNDQPKVAAAKIQTGEEKGRAVRGNIWQTLFRQIEIIMTLILGGWLFFRYIIWEKPSTPSPTPVIANQDKRFFRFHLRGLFLLGFIVYLVTGMGDIWIRAGELSSANPENGDFLPVFMQVAGGTALGIVGWLRPLIMLGMLVFVSVNRTPNRLLIGLAVAGLLITFPLTGHAAGNGMVFSHSVHLLVATAWFGGLLGFTVYSFLLEKEVENLRLLHERLTLFSALALLAVLLAAFTGAVMVVAYLWGKAEPVNPVYKMALFWKIVLFAGALLVAALHRFLWLPRLQKTEWQAKNDIMVQEEVKKNIRRLFMGLRAELLLAAAITLLAAVMSTVSPLLTESAPLEQQTTPGEQHVPGESLPASHSH